MTSTISRPLAARPAPDVQPLSPRRLAELTRWYAGQLRAGALGRVHYGDPARPGDPDARWHVRVHADDLVDIWLISWLPTQGTQLHDHGGSSGAFTVVSGTLTESVWQPGTGELHDRRHTGPVTVAFDEHRVHDVRNLGTEPAISVHAYSSPLARMRFFDIDDGSLHLTSVLDTTDPEPEV